MPPRNVDFEASRLAAARVLAWSLWFGGWLVLGSLGREAASPGWQDLGGLGPLAVWLAAIGACLRWGQDRRLTGAQLRVWLIVAGAGTGAALTGTRQPPSLWAAAVGWGVLLVLASRAVRLLRQGQRRNGSPARPAAIGALLAWSMAEPAHGPPLAVGVALAALALAVLVPRTCAGRGCRSGLFDCVWPASLHGHRSPLHAARAAARWSMLPMMATLPRMAEWCAAPTAWSPGTMTALHLAVMVLPAGLWSVWSPGRAVLRPIWVAVPLMAGLAALAMLPGSLALTAASLAGALAWGLDWAQQLALPTRAGAAAPAQLPTWRALSPAVGAAALGLGIAAHGPNALAFMLALGGAAALAGSLRRPARRVSAA